MMVAAISSIERVAVNLIDARIPDNAGDRPQDVPVRPEAPSAYFSTLPVKAIREMGRSTQGVTLINLGEGEKLAGLERVAEADEEDVA